MKFEAALPLLREGKSIRRGIDGDTLKMFRSVDTEDTTIMRERGDSFYPWQPAQSDILADNYEEVTDAE